MDGNVFSKFKYRPINKHLIESLTEPSLYFAKPSKLNDPFDCRVDLSECFERVAASAIPERAKWLLSFRNNPFVLDNWKAQFENAGVCAFSATPNETLLWAHYADNHRGVCLYYELPEVFIKDPGLQMTLGGRVEYESEPVTALLTTASPEMSLESFVTKLVQVYLLAKDPAWRYEQEARLINRESGVFKLTGEYMTQVCFGLQTPQADIDLSFKLARDYCGCKRFGRMIRKGDFGFAMVRL
jgi:hypothetical protein